MRVRLPRSNRSTLARIHMRTVLAATLLLLSAAASGPLATQAVTDPSCTGLPKAPAAPVFSEKIRGEYLKNGKTSVHDIYLQTQAGDQSRAFLIAPSQPAPNPGAVFFVHLL